MFALAPGMLWTVLATLVPKYVVEVFHHVEARERADVWGQNTLRRKAASS
jgi:hypothetical protein